MTLVSLLLIDLTGYWNLRSPYVVAACPPVELLFAIASNLRHGDLAAFVLTCHTFGEVGAELLYLRISVP